MDGNTGKPIQGQDSAYSIEMASLPNEDKKDPERTDSEITEKPRPPANAIPTSSFIRRDAET